MAELRRTLAACAAGDGGEVSTRHRAATLASGYRALDAASKLAFLELLARDFGPAPDRVRDALARGRDAITPAGELALRRALVTPRRRILLAFTALPDGVTFLVDLRAELLRALPSHPDLAILDFELFELLSAWFDHGLLDLRRITWDSPASLLERLIQYEAVHEIRSWTDLRNRLDSDRRCYAFFHHRMPDEPLIFVEVALVADLASNVQALLDEHEPTLETTRARTAIFYSISTTQPGLRGINFGGFLIKRVVEHLRLDVPRLRTFATLSPVPGFRAWLDSAAGAARLAAADEREWRRLARKTGISHATASLREVIEAGDWAQNAAMAEALAPVLCRLLAVYLTQEKRESLPADPVARFHLGNGARLERINWAADTSPNGLAQSCGMMVNYLYVLGDLERNHERYARGEVVVSAATRRLIGASASAGVSATTRRAAPHAGRA